MRRFEGKAVMVTGAASGIGRASAERFASEGAALFLTDIEGEGLESCAKLCRELGASVATQICDVSDASAAKASVEAAVAELGALDSLCNIAGILHFDNTHELSLEQWNRILAVNLTGTFLVTQAALPQLLKSRGNVVNTASTAAIAGQPWTAAYSASKGGVLAFTYTLAVEYGKQGLRANALCPGGIETAIQKVYRVPDGADPKLIRRVMPLDKMRGPEAAASVVVFLASDDAAHMNGEYIRVDGATLS